MKRKEDEPRKDLARATPARGARTLLWLVALLCAGCGRSPRAAPPGPVVIISVDTLRADHLPVYGYRGVQTPAIDAIARDSMIFENAYSNVPLTLPSHAALLTGLLPFENGVRDNIGFRLDPGRRTLASLLRSASYATGAAVSSYVLRADRGLAAGFDYYDDSMPENPARERPGLESAAVLAKWGESVRGRPLFLFLHIYEPHAPYKPPEPFASRYASAPYDGEIAAADAAVGSFVEFLEARGPLRPGDPGLSLRSRGRSRGPWGAGAWSLSLSRGAARAAPSQAARLGRRGREDRGSGLADRRRADRALAPFHSRSERLARRRVDVARRRRRGGRSADLLGDPLSASRPGVERSRHRSPTRATTTSTLRARSCTTLPPIRERRTTWPPGLPPPFRSLRAALEAMNRPFSMPEASSPEELKKLAALGYISVSPGSPAGGPLPDPKDKVQALAELKRVFELYYAGRYSEAIPPARALVAREPQVLSAWNILSDSLGRTGKVARGDRSPAQRHRRRAAGDLLGRAARAGVREPLAARRSARATRPDASERSGRRSRAGSPPSAPNAISPGSTSGRDATPRRWRCSRPVRPSTEAESLETLGIALAGVGKIAEAKEALLAALGHRAGQRAHRLQPGDASSRRRRRRGGPGLAPEVSAVRFRLRRRRGRSSVSPRPSSRMREGAERSWRRAIELDPRQYNSLYNLAVSELRAGRTEEGRAKLERFLAAAPRKAVRAAARGGGEDPARACRPPPREIGAASYAPIGSSRSTRGESDSAPFSVTSTSSSMRTPKRPGR